MAQKLPKDEPILSDRAASTSEAEQSQPNGTAAETDKTPPEPRRSERKRSAPQMFVIPQVLRKQRESCIFPLSLYQIPLPAG